MKKAVAYLEPFLEDTVTKNKEQKCIILATVKGDVHDIGKNIVGVVLQCNGYRVVDLGVMVPAQDILKKAIQEKADVIGLSGLITPSLDEMVHVASEMKRQGLELPLLIGGATTSKIHTAVRIDPTYPNAVIHVQDASKAVGVVSNLFRDDSKEEYTQTIKETYDSLRVRHAAGKKRVRVPFLQSQKNAFRIDFDEKPPPKPHSPGIHLFEDIPIQALRAFIDWSPFFSTWEIPGQFPRILEDPEKGQTARSLFSDAEKMLDRIEKEAWIKPSAICGILPVEKDGDDVVVVEQDGSQRHFHFLRQQAPRSGGRPHLALSDFLAPTGDHLGFFVVQAGLGIQRRVEDYKKGHDDYNAILLESIADRLAEACAEWLHHQVRTKTWGYADEESFSPDELHQEKYTGVRPAPGYPACPDHTEKETIFELLDARNKLGISLTESMAIQPASAVSGWFFAHPDSHYFGIGKIGEDQLKDYAKRKGWDLDTARRWLRPNLEI